MFSFLQGQLHRRRGQLLQHLDGGPQGRGRLRGEDRQASGRSDAEGGGGSSEGLPEGQREGFDQLLSGPIHHWRHGKTNNIGSMFGLHSLILAGCFYRR